ncbi:UNVERIFIED_CONTAM: hypothetical protein FKN15_049535 [Acipenser sinensis]
MKCLREKGQGPRIDQYFLRSQSSQSNEIQRQEANHSSQDISTPVIDVRRTCMDTVSDEPNDPCEPDIKIQRFVMNTFCDPDLSKVTDCMEHALKAKFPRTRYSAGWDAKVGWIPFSYAPAFIIDSMLNTVLPRPAQSA